MMRRHNYVVGYGGEGQVAYGKRLKDRNDFIDLLTLKQAQKLKKKIVCLCQNGEKINKSIIYKLVEVKNDTTDK